MDGNICIRLRTKYTCGHRVRCRFIENEMRDDIAMFIRRILAPVLRVEHSIPTLNARSILLTVGTDVYVLKKVSLVSTVRKV